MAAGYSEGACGVGGGLQVGDADGVGGSAGGVDRGASIHIPATWTVQGFGHLSRGPGI